MIGILTLSDKLLSVCDSQGTLFCFNTLRLRRNRRHFAGDILKRIFWNENLWILIKISLKFIPKHPVNNITALVQIIAWRWAGNKQLCKPMIALFADVYICITWTQRVNSEGLAWWKCKLVWTARETTPFLWRDFVKNFNPFWVTFSSSNI